MTRASSAYVDVIDGGAQKLYQVGANFLRCAERTDLAGVTDAGYLPEPVETNYCFYGTAMSSWTKRGTAASVDATTETTDPQGGYLACKITGIGAYTVDDIYQLLNGFGASAYISPSFWIKRISTSGTLRLFATYGLGCWDIDMSALPDTWVRIDESSPYKTQVTDWQAHSSGYIYYYFTGLSGSPLSFYCWCPMLTTNPVCAGSDILTTTNVGVTRAADALRYKGDEGNLGGVGSNKRGRVKVRLLLPNHDSASTPAIVDLADGTSDNDRITSYVAASGDKATLQITAGGASKMTDGPAVDVADGNWKTIEYKWGIGAARITVAGVSATGTPDDIPDDLDTISVGCDRAGAYGLGGLINTLEIYDR
jgi:hypothetical protein